MFLLPVLKINNCKKKIWDRDNTLGEADLLIWAQQTHAQVIIPGPKGLTQSNFAMEPVTTFSVTLTYI